MIVFQLSSANSILLLIIESGANMKLSLQYLIPLAFISVSIFNPLIAQVVITHSIGDEISVEEALEYELFSDIQDFTGATFSKISGKIGAYLMSYTYENEEGQNRVTIKFGTGLKDIFNNSLVQLDSVFSGFEIHRTQKIRMILKSGTSLIGSFIKWNGDDITIMTDFGEQRIDLEMINDFTLLDIKNFVDGEYRPPDPNYTRLFFSPNGRSLKTGKGYFSDYEIFFPGFAYGINDKFSIGGGIFPFTTGDFFMGWFTPKISIVETEEYAIAVGLLSILISGGNDNFNAGIVYGVGTWGEPDDAITFGFGYGYAESKLADKPMLMVGYEKRIGKRTKLLSENWIFPGLNEPLFSLGFRWFGEKFAGDFALIRTLDTEFIGFPWVDIVVNF